jgi:hypothetical protein
MNDLTNAKNKRAKAYRLLAIVLGIAFVLSMVVGNIYLSNETRISKEMAKRYEQRAVPGPLILREVERDDHELPIRALTVSSDHDRGDGDGFRAQRRVEGETNRSSRGIRQATTPSEVTPEYGLLWWIPGKPEQPVYAAQGWGGERIVVLPKARAVVVILAATRLDSGISDEDLRPLTEGVLAPALL